MIGASLGDERFIHDTHTTSFTRVPFGEADSGDHVGVNRQSYNLIHAVISGVADEGRWFLYRLPRPFVGHHLARYASPAADSRTGDHRWHHTPQ